ncbi:hypothetical protein [Dyadobacter crusticola]|uniref:hypothetical protein n=1 Tax=Dyadobacter crusticola TaxID=292407 RepID=UPI0004E13AF1|nr:hypothetical protein [Dyadobacter crusticola]
MAKDFRRTRFVIIFSLLTSASAFTFISAWKREEGTSDNSTLSNFFADSFSIFRFPVHTLLLDRLESQDGGAFLLGLVVNVAVYTVIIEILLSRVIRKK